MGFLMLSSDFVAAELGSKGEGSSSSGHSPIHSQWALANSKSRETWFQWSVAQWERVCALHVEVLASSVKKIN